MKTVREVMSSPVITVSPATPYKQIVATLLEHDISAVPVVEERGALTGIVSEADLLVKEAAPARHRVLWTELASERRLADKAEGAVAADVMSAPVVTVHRDMPVANAARLMRQRSVKRLPVVDETGALVGIVSRADVLKPFLRDDAEIRAEIVETVLPRWLFIDPEHVAVAVRDGTVTLTGTVDGSSDVEIIGSVVARLDGVVAVDNRLSFVVDDRSLKTARAEAPIR